MSRLDLPGRLRALDGAVHAARGRLDETAVGPAQTVVARAAERLRLSTSHTVVALAGPTGSGKSSLFNAICGLDLARVGVRRPTTAEPLACVWEAQGAGPLLEWLGISRRHQVAHESVLDPQGADGLGGLVLLDLPDHDSTTLAHRLEVDRLVGLVDVFVWVVDPQKYADAALHGRYLRPLAAHGGVTVVVLNQVDRLSEPERDTCLADLRRILAGDGLAGASVLATSVRSGEGVDRLREVLRTAVSRRRAAEERLAGDVTSAAQRLLDAAGTAGEASVSRRDRAALVDSLADAAGVPVVVSAVQRSTVRRARAATGWPVTRWLGRLRPDPVRRLRLDRTTVDPELVRSSLPEPTRVQRARADAAVRGLADAVADGASPAEVGLVHDAASRAAGELPDRLDRAVVAVDLGVGRRPLWWGLAGALQWAAFAVTLVGLGWLGFLWVLAWLRVPDPPTPEWHGWPWPTLLLIGGLLVSLLVALLSRVAAAAAGRRRAGAARRRLNAAVAGVAEEVVVEPVLAEVQAMASVREQARLARG